MSATIIPFQGKPAPKKAMDLEDMAKRLLDPARRRILPLEPEGPTAA